MEDLSDFQKGQIGGAHLARASVTKMGTLLGVSTAAVSKVMTAYTNDGNTSSPKRNRGHKPKLSERECRRLNRIVSKIHRTTAAMVTTELIHLEDPVSTKTVWQELHKSNIFGTAEIAKSLITENSA